MPTLDSTMLTALKSAIGTSAPTLAGLLDGPDAAIPIRALAKTLLGDSEAALPEIVAAAQKSDQLKITAAEQEAQLRLRQSASRSLLDLVPPDAAAPAPVPADPVPAGQAQVATHDATSKWLAYIVTAAFFVLIGLLVYFRHGDPTFDPDVKNLLFILLGVVATGWANIIGFYYGSSAGSAQKSQTISTALLQSGAPPAAN
jgi:hypothetical protein